jgi:hypothetical protein
MFHLEKNILTKFQQGSETIELTYTNCILLD